MASLLLMNFIAILRETFKLLIKNCKIFSSIALFILVINSIAYLFNFYSIKPLLTDLFIEATILNNTIPGTPEFTEIITEIKKDSKSILLFELIYFTINSAFFLLSTTATILAAAIIYGEKEHHLSLKDLVSKTFKSWLRPLITWLYVLFFTLIYFFIFGAVIFFVAMIEKSPKKLIFVAIPLGLSAMVLYMYLSVTWLLGIVISAIEKIKGTKAIGKARELIEGMKLQGFMVNVLLNILTSILQFGIQLIPINFSISLIVVRGVVIVYLSSLVNMYHFAAFTVIYCMCKKNHGERVELERSGSYSKLPTTAPPLVDDKLP